MKKALKVLLGILFLSIIIVFGGAYVFYKFPEVSIGLQLIGKNQENPELDAKEDIAQGKIICYSINGFGKYFPGVNGKEGHELCHLGIEINFMGTSDAIESERHAKAIGRAESYASKYNKYMVHNSGKKI